MYLNTTKDYEVYNAVINDALTSQNITNVTHKKDVFNATHATLVRGGIAR